MTVLRIGVCLAVAFAVLAHGAVEPWSGSLLAILAAALFLVWGGIAFFRHRTEIELNPLLLPVLGLGLVALAQWGLGLSAYPYLSRVEWMNFTALFLLAFVATQAFRHLEDWRPFVWFLLFLGFAVALFGILQHFTWNGKIYWVRELRESTYSFGPFVNRNHFAGFMELVIPFGLAMFLYRDRRDPLPMALLFTGVAIGALLLSASRGGMVSFAFELAVLAVFALARRVGKAALALALGVLLLAGVFAVWLGVAEAFSRFRGDWSDDVTSSRRLVIVRDSWQLFLEHPVLGTGAGTFSTVYPRVESFHDGKIVNHAHNDYIELLVEMGALGGLLAFLFLLLLFRNALRSRADPRLPKAAAIRVGALVACSGLLLHSLVDFNLHIPSNALLFLLCACTATAGEREAAVIPLRRENLES